MVDVEVVGRHLFYNNSSFDGNDPAANEADDAAIATDKSALLPGGTATFANYSSYASGINGVMIDVAGLPTAALMPDDFSLRVGNVSDTSTWTTAPLQEFAVRLGAGAQGAARVELTWEDGLIAGQWLEVTLKATPRTGLTKDDVFYFGNAIGDTGNSAANAIVDDADLQGVIAHPRGAGDPAPVDFAYDFDRDGLVDEVDELITVAYGTTAGTALQLIAPPVPAAGPEYQRPPFNLFNWGDGGHPSQYSPTLITTNAGTVLAFTDAWATSQDPSSYAVIVRRSSDGGATFDPATIVYGVPPATGTRIAAMSAVVDRPSGRIVVLFTRDITDVLMVTSEDDGLTWTAPVIITNSIKVTAGNNPGPPGAYPDTPWGWYAIGPGHGIQLEHGPHAGRLIITADHRESVNNDGGPSWSHVIYSDDGGLTWQLGGGLQYEGGGVPSDNDYSNENQVVELSNGDLYMTIRINTGSVFANLNRRGTSRSTDGGITWSDMRLAAELTVPEVHGSILRLNENVILFAAPDNAATDMREGMTVWVSYDDAQTWTKKKTVFFGFSSYSDMTVVGPDTVLLAYNRGFTGGAFIAGATGFPRSNTDTALVRLNLRWLENSDPYQFVYYFNEGAPGTRANPAGYAVQDYGPWDQRARAYYLNDTGASLYVSGASGDSALALTDNQDEVVLSVNQLDAFQFDLNDSFTIELVMKTGDANGVVLGTRLDIKGWRLSIVDGKLQFIITDMVDSPTINSDARVDDNQWHHISVVRDATARTISLFVDGEAAATPISDTTSVARTSADPADAVILGAASDLSQASQLAMVVDTLRITRAVLATDDFLPVDFIPPTPPPAPQYAENSPTSIPGLQLWLPPYDPTRFYADFNQYADPLPWTPFDGVGTRAARELSPNQFKVSPNTELRSVQYGQDDKIGPYWKFTANSSLSAGSELRVRNTSGNSTTNFNFVQDTGVFTLSAFINVTANTGGYMTIFDTNEGQATLPGFSLLRQHDGRLSLLITGGTPETVRFSEAAPSGAMNLQTWYHVAAVGTGPGNPIKFYVTALDSKTVTELTSTGVLAGANGSYSTNLNHDLYIGGRSGSSSGAQPFNGGLVNETIFDRALAPLEIQKLFQYGKSQSLSGHDWLNQNVAMDVSNDGNVFPIDAQQVVNRLILWGTGPLPAANAEDPPPFVDVSGNGILEPLDAQIVVNWLIKYPTGGGSVVPLTMPQGAQALSASATADNLLAVPAVESTLPATPLVGMAAAAQDGPAASVAANLTSSGTGQELTPSATVAYFAMPAAHAESPAPKVATAAILSVPTAPLADEVAGTANVALDLLDAPELAGSVVVRDDESDASDGGADADDALAADRFFAELGAWS